MNNRVLADAIEALCTFNDQPWRVEQEPHNYSDGTTHFTHVVHDFTDSTGDRGVVRVGEYVTPELAEMMCLLMNNRVAIINALKKG